MFTVIGNKVVDSDSPYKFEYWVASLFSFAVGGMVGFINS